ncbi:RNA polymerase II subunit A C-terminal domain phosphatase [Nymphon striatum]|nr:RNA polymerase II subunit A C-terminal domain phosphatase [Nymphon striatum]
MRVNMAASVTREIANTTGSTMVINAWKVFVGAHVSNSSILFSYYSLEDQSKNVKKFPARSIGTVHEILLREGAEVAQGQTILRLTGCKHPTVMKDLCAECGADLRIYETDTFSESNQASISMVHSVPELKVSQELAMQIGKADENRLINAHKLVLLVDLDQTLIHTTNDNIPNNIKLYGPNSPWYHTRLRPGTREFLENVSKMYELHICTFGVRVYAHKIASILDSDGKYFAHRILSRDECFNPASKTANLKALFPCGDSMVCIIDDREDVWNFSPNLIPVKPYHFFQHTGDIHAPPGLDKTEQDSDDEEDNLLLRVIKSALNKKTNNEIVGDNSANSISRLGQSNSKVDTDEVDDETDNLEQKPGVQSSPNATQVLQNVVTIETKNEFENLKKSAEEESDSTISKALNTDIDISTPKNENSEEVLSNILDEECDTNCEDLSNTNVQSSEENSVKKEDQSDKMIQNGNNVDITKPESNGSSNSKSCKNSDVITSVDSKDDFKKETEKIESDKLISKDKKGDTPNNSEDCQDGLVDVEDTDDYLLYLEEILSMIHKAYYKIHKQTKKLQKPDMKNVVPYVRMKVLKNVNVVFSGVIPTNMPVEKNKAYIVAKSLGVTIQPKLVSAKMAKDPSKITTHLIAVHPGTAKVIEAKKIKGMHIVDVKWLWSCSERWEHVDERLFPLTKVSSNRSSPISRRSPFLEASKKVGSSQNKTSKPELSRYDPVTGKKIQKESNLPIQKPVSFAESYSPLLTFSSADIADMDKEVEDIFNEESDESGQENELLKTREKSSSEESLSNDRPRGWKRKHSERWKDFVMSSKDDDEDQANTQSSSESENGNHSKYLCLDKLDPDSDQSDFDESVGSVDEEMAAAIEREMLNS